MFVRVQLSTFPDFTDQRLNILQIVQFDAVVAHHVPYSFNEFLFLLREIADADKLFWLTAGI